MEWKPPGWLTVKVVGIFLVTVAVLGLLLWLLLPRLQDWRAKAEVAKTGQVVAETQTEATEAVAEKEVEYGRQAVEVVVRTERGVDRVDRAPAGKRYDALIGELCQSPFYAGQPENDDLCHGGSAEGAGARRSEEELRRSAAAEKPGGD